MGNIPCSLDLCTQNIAKVIIKNELTPLQSVVLKKIHFFPSLVRSALALANVFADMWWGESGETHGRKGPMTALKEAKTLGMANKP